MAESKLRRILHKRRKVSRKKTEVEVRDSVLRLVFESQDLQGILTELKAGTCSQNADVLSRKHEASDDQDDVPLTTDGDAISSLLVSFKYQSEISGLPLSLVSAKECSGLLSELLTDKDYQGDRENKYAIFCTSEQRKKLDVLVETLAKLASDPAHFDHAHFMECIRNKVALPLELIWILNKHSIVTFDLFIKSNLGDAEVYRKLTTNILCLMKGEFPQEKGSLAQNILSDLLTALVSYAFSDEDHSLAAHEKSLQEAYQLLLDTIFNGLFDHCLAVGDDKRLFLESAWLDVTSLNQFTSGQLLSLLCYKPTWTVTQAITQQVTWTSAKTSPALTKLFKALSSGLETKQRIDILRRTLEEEEVNWKTTLMFSSFLLLDSTDAGTHYKELLDYFIREAFESIEQEGLISAFLLARQAASEGTHVFIPYKDWFQTTFCDGSHPLLSSKKEVTFFLSFLTNLVPLEPAQFLKVHVQHSSFVPAKYNVMLDDYITLAKTRLTDLKVPWDSTGIFKTKRAESESDGTTIQTKNPVEADVVRAVEAFEQTGKIPSTVIQAIMFKRKYYHCYFLPTLLAPRMLPDIPDSKMKLILALNEANKIPAELYREYEGKCGEILNDLLEGAFSEDVVMEELLEPMDALKADCKKLNQMVQDGADEAGVRRQISLISDSLKSLTSNVDGRQCEVVDLDEGSLDKTLVEIIDVVLTCICTATTPPSGGATQSSSHCQESFAAMLAGHSALHQTLLKRIWTVVVKKTADESEKLDLDLSIICAVLHVYQLQGRLPKLKTNKLVGQHTIITAVMETLQHSTSELMSDILRFFFGALQSLLKREGDPVEKNSVPKQLIQKFCYLTDRMKTASTHAIERCITGRIFEDISNFSTSKKFMQLKKSTGMLSFSQWCLWELHIVPHLDILSDVERCSYQHHAVFSEFLPQLQSSSTANLYWSACETIINAIMDTDSSPHLTSPEERGMKCSCRREMIHLVAELLWMMPPEQTAYRECLQLLSMITRRLQRPGQDPVLTTARVREDIKSFFGIVVCLPPIFLLVNHPVQSAYDSLFTYLALILKDKREHVMEEPIALPLPLTRHMFQAVISLASCCGSLDDVLGRLISASMLVKTSIMYYWPKLKPLVMSGLQNSALYAQFDSVYSQAAALISRGQAASLDMSGLDCELLGTAIYHNLCQNSHSSLEQWKQNSCQLDRQICIFLAVLLVNHTAWSLLHQSEESSQLLEILIRLFQQDQSLMKDVFIGTPYKDLRYNFHPHAADLAPVVFFWCLEDSNCVIWESVPTGSLLTVALECHKQVREIFLQSQQDVPLVSTEVFSVERLAVYNNIIRRMVLLSPPDVIRAVPVELIRACSPLVQSFFKVHPP